MCLFGSAVINKPEALLDAEFTKRGRIEHHFYALNSASIVFIEIKKIYAIGNARLNLVAQVLAECSSMFESPLFVATSDVHNTTYSL